EVELRATAKKMLCIEECSSSFSSFVEIRIENANLDDGRHRQHVAVCRAADGFRGRRVVHAKRFLLVRTHVGVNPCDLVGHVAVDDCQAGPGPKIVDGNIEPVRELSLDDVPWHGVIPSLVWSTTLDVKEGRERGL